MNKENEETTVYPKLQEYLKKHPEAVGAGFGALTLLGLALIIQVPPTAMLGMMMLGGGILGFICWVVKKSFE